jgi:transcriptional regulator with XRE-family HTH domain
METWKQACTALKESAELQGKTPEQLAKATGLKASNITRIFEAKYAPPLDVYFQIEDCLKTSFVVSLLKINPEKVSEELISLWKKHFQEQVEKQGWKDVPIKFDKFKEQSTMPSFKEKLG